MTDKTSLFQHDFPPEEFRARRARLFDTLGVQGCALVQGAGPVERSEPFRQTNEFYYLCGVEVPRALLLLDGRSRTTTLFLPHRDERQERSEGPSFAAEDEALLSKLAGVDSVRPVEDLLPMLNGIDLLFTPHSPAEGAAMYRDESLHAARQIAADPWDPRTPREAQFIHLLHERCPTIEIKDLSPALDDLRLIKSPREIELMRRAGQLTALAVKEAMRCTRPGVYEYQLGAVAEYIYRSNGAAGVGYRAIIAGGSNIWYAHYYRNNQPLADGEVVLMDFAPDYHYYTSDIGRTWPVNGHFSDVQRESYGFITTYHKALLQRIRPGKLPAAVLAETASHMAAVIEETQFSKPVYQAAALRALEFTGHLSHPVGMAVHDVGSYSDRPMQPGLVISVDPQLWIPEEQLYIRVEDTVVLTETGIENLTALAPLELEEIERSVGRGDTLQRLPEVV